MKYKILNEHKQITCNSNKQRIELRIISLPYFLQQMNSVLSYKDLSNVNKNKLSNVLKRSQTSSSI